MAERARVWEKQKMQVKAIRYHKPGGPDVLQLDNVELGAPGAGQALVRHTAIGLNYIDVYFRSGSYPVSLPAGCGSEAAGVVESVGAGVANVKPGDRVAYLIGEPGAYAEARLYPAERLVRLPDGVSDETAAAIMLKGVTAEYLLRRCAPLQAGYFALMYAASGGVGLLAGQVARHIGAKLIGVASGPEKCALAMRNGYHAVIDRTKEDILARVKEITGGNGVPVVYDSIGKATYETTLSCLAPRGFFVSFGATTGLPPAVDPALLQKMGSLYFTRPTLSNYAMSRPDLELSTGYIFDLATAGALVPNIGKRYRLAEAAQAHADLESGRTVGASILLP